MSTHSNDPAFRRDDGRNIYQDLRRRNERRMNVARILEARRVRQIERVVQAARERRFRRSEK